MNSRSLLVAALFAVLSCAPPSVSCGGESEAPRRPGNELPTLEDDAGQFWPPRDTSKACSAADAVRWRAALHTERFLQATQSCAAASARSYEGYSTCVLREVGVSGCQECASRALGCLFTRCEAACGWAGEPWTCRWCACREGCEGECGLSVPPRCSVASPLHPSLILMSTL